MDGDRCGYLSVYPISISIHRLETFLNCIFALSYITLKVSSLFIEHVMHTHILHATDLSREHFTMSEKACEIARCFNAKLYLLHAIEPPMSLQLAQGLGFAEFYKPMKEDATLVMRALGEALSVPVEQQYVEVGSIKMHVLEKAQKLNCTLIILGRHTPNGLPAFLGSTAHAVIHHAHCDVLTLQME
jgi:universal stress protein A